MAQYKISDLEMLSGIKSHTIRIWEQRYNLLKPSRTDTNIRFYDDEQLRKLLNVVSLLDAGFKISKIAKLSPTEINSEVDAQTKVLSTATDNILINQLISAGLNYDERGFNDAMSTAMDHYGMTESYNKVLHPMLVRIGVLWTTAELIPAQEHFISSLVKQKLAASIENLKVEATGDKWVLFLPDQEEHEIGLLNAYYHIKLKGDHVYYLGPKVPLENINHIVDALNPQHLLFFLIRNTPLEESQDFIDELAKFKNLDVTICCTVATGEGLKLHKNQKVVYSYDQFLDRIK